MSTWCAPHDGTIDQVRVGPGVDHGPGLDMDLAHRPGRVAHDRRRRPVDRRHRRVACSTGWTSTTGATCYTLPLTTGTPRHFAAPSAAGGMLVVAGAGHVEAFR